MREPVPPQGSITSNFIGENLVHIGSILFFYRFFNDEYTESEFSVAEMQCYHVADFYLRARFCGSAVYFDSAAVASLVGYGTAFDYSGYFEKFVKSHIYILLRRAGSSSSVLQ